MTKLTINQHQTSTVDLFWQSTYNLIQAYVTPKRRASDIQLAFNQFAKEHPQWVALFFDQSFVDHQLSQLILLYQRYDRNPSAMDIALLWDEYYGEGTLDERKRAINELASALSSFLNLLSR